jgi:hypothetical protein
LPDLVRLAFAADFLQVDKFGDVRVLEDVMTAANACQPKTEALDQIAKVSKANVLNMAIEEAT